MIKVFFALVGVILAGAVLTVGGIGYSLALENQDSFCASCHTEPEVTYYNQSVQTNAVTLAAFHRQKKTACIDCHSGGGPLGRSKGLIQGIDDTIIYWSGNYHRPAITTNPLGDDSCTKCHADIFTQRRGASRSTNGHYHAFLPRWQAQDANAAGCTTCHASHPQGTASQQFMMQSKVNQTCDQCHRALGEGGRD